MYLFFKRAFDIALASLLIVLCSPVLIGVAILLRFTGEREVLYRQRRIGFKKQYFDIYKFASMLKDSPNMGTKSITLRNDPRVTTVGRYIRMTKINELPQLFNVLLGHMTLVGPRPFVDETFDAYPQSVQERVYDRRPGLTGVGSIIYRDEEEIISKSPLPPKECYRQVIAPHKGALEIWYQENCSFFVDLTLLILTCLSVVFPRASELLYVVFPTVPRPDPNVKETSVVEDAALSGN